MPLSLSTIQTKFENRKKDISDVGTALFKQWVTSIADLIYDNKRDVDPEQLISTQTYTVSTEPQVSVLPSDFLGMQELGTGVFRVDSDGKDSDDELVVTGFGSRQRGYYLDGSGNIVFTGISDGNQYKLRYMPTSPEFSEMTEYFTLDKTSTGKQLIPNSKFGILIEILDVYYSRWDEDISGEISADQRFVRELERLLDKNRRTPLAISLPDFTGDF